MKLRIHSSLVGSLILHAVLLACVVFRFHPPPFVPVLKPRPQILVETPRTSIGQSHSQRHSLRDKKTPSAQRSKPISLKDLGVFSSRGLPLAGGDSSKVDSAEERPSAFGFENQVTTQTSPILSFLFHQINNGIAFPSELREAWESSAKATILVRHYFRWLASVLLALP